MKKKKFLPLLLLFVMAGEIHGETIGYSGTCGNCQWSVEHEKLTIKPLAGTDGILNSWVTDQNVNAPWSEYAESIREIEISSTVYAKTVRAMFAGMKNLRSMDLTGLNVGQLEDKESLKLDSNNEGYMFYQSSCPSVITLPDPNNLRIDDMGIPLPSFIGAADYIQKVGNGDIYNPKGSIYKSYEEMKTAWDNKGEDNIWNGTYVLMKALKASTYSVNSTTGLGTLCYPADVTLLSNNEWKAKAYRITGYRIENGNPTLELTQWSNGTLTANTPVMLYKEGGATLTLSNVVTDFSLAPRVISQDGNLLKGCYGTPTIFGDPDGYVYSNSYQYVYQTQNEKTSFYRVNPNRPIHATSFRCYLELPKSSVTEQKNAPKFDFVIPSGDVTSVLDVFMEQGESNRQGVYDLQGRRVKEMIPGNIYVVNGVKVVVK